MNTLSYFDAFTTRYEHYKGGSWCYEDGCIYRGLVMLHRTTGEARWIDHLIRLVTPQIGPDGTLAGYSIDEFNIDNILAGRCLFHLADVTGDPRYMRAAATLAEQLSTHPRTAAGNYWHKKRYPQQVWLDGLYMGLPFQIEYGLRTGDETLVSDALAQIDKALEVTSGPNGLLVHAYDDAREQPWADKTTGQSAAVWARALGWVAMALTDIAALVPDRAPIAATFALLDAIVREQAVSGLWLQVLDAPELEGNYEESSASAMFAYALMRAARLGIGDFAHAGEKAWNTLTSERLAEVGGMTQMTTIVHVAGLGGYESRYRDGSKAYYLTEPIVEDDSKGVGPLMMAAAEYLRAHPA